MFSEDNPEKQRCEGCEYNKLVYATGQYSFRGCYCKPYKGKRVAEIKHCPKEKGEQNE